MTQPLVDIGESADALDIIISVAPSSTAGREQLRAGLELALYFTRVARVQLLSAGAADCKTLQSPECEAAAILSCASRLENRASASKAIGRLAAHVGDEFEPLLTELRGSYPELASCLDAPMTAISSDRALVPELAHTNERPHIWIDGLHFDGPLTRQEIESHIAFLLLERRNGAQSEGTK